MNYLDQVRQFFQDGIESVEPFDTILQVFVENEGKRLDVRLIKKIAERIDVNVRLVKEYGMTQIYIGNYGNSRGQEGASLLLSGQATTHLTVSSEELLRLNPAYYSARDARNLEREQILGNEKVLYEFAKRQFVLHETRQTLANAESAAKLLADEHFHHSLSTNRELTDFMASSLQGSLNKV